MKNIVEFEARTSIDQQAREWLIRLDGDKPLNSVEREALREWMARSPAHREELTRISKFWSQANVLAELSVPLEGTALHRTTHGKHKTRTLLATAATVVAAILCGTWWLISQETAANGTYATVIGQQQTISLPDHSSVHLNTDSQVQIIYSKHARRLRLLRGEALFSVAHDPNRAFEVYAGDGMVRAVGTAFSVHLDGNKIDVTVTKGVVDVTELDSSHTGKSFPRPLGRLKAGQATTFGNKIENINVRELAEPELQRRMAWHDGYLLFAGEPLEEVVRQVNRYSPVTLEIADPSLTSVAIGGRFKIGDLDAVLEVLHDTFNIQWNPIDEHSIRLGAMSRNNHISP